MKSYWQTLTEREKILVSCASILLSVTAIYMLIFRPLVAYHAESDRVYTRALDQFQTVRAYASHLDNLTDDASTKSPNQPRASLRMAVSSAARAADIEISRLQPSEDGTLTIWAEQIQSQQLFLWLDTLAKSHSIGPQNVLIQKTSVPGNLRVQLQFLDASW